MGTTRSSTLLLLATFLAGALLSAVVVLSTVETAPPETESEGPTPPEQTSTPKYPSAPADPEETGVTGATLGAPATDEELEFLRSALAAERQRRHDLAEQAREHAVKSADHGLQVMNRYLEYGADVSGVLADFAAMRSHIRIESGPVRRFESTGERTKVNLSTVENGTAVVEFGPGTFVLSGKWKGVGSRQKITSLEIRGAGMDRTTLIGPGWAFLIAGDDEQVQNLSIRDVTIDGAERRQIILDARGGIAAVLERVRIVGWPVAGLCAAMGGSGRSFLACRECDFIGPGDGWVLSLRGPALALFDHCRFEGTDGAITVSSGDWRPAQVRVNDCAFEGIRLTNGRLKNGKSGGANVVVTGGTAAIGSSSWTEEKRLQHFRAAEASSIAGLVFTSAEPRFSVAAAARVLDLAAANGLGHVIALELQGAPPGGPVELDIYVHGEREGSGPSRYTRLFDGSTLKEPGVSPRRGQRAFDDMAAASYATTLPVGTLLREAKIAPDESVRSVVLESRRVVDAKVGFRTQLSWTIELVGGTRLGLDAETGKELWRR